MSVKDSDLMSVADEVYMVTAQLIAEGRPPFAVAAALTMIGMQIYKSSLSKEDYERMIDSISESRDKIKSLPEMVNESSMKSMH